MGNAVSCTPFVISSNDIVKVILYNGRVKIYTRRVRAAELMLENLGEFVCDYTTLKIGHKIMGVSADEELKRHKLYFLLPIEVLHSFLTFDQFNALTHNYCSSRALLNDASFSFGEKFAFLRHFCVITSSKAKKIGDGEEVEHFIPLTAKRYSRQGSWRPALETIFETPPRAI